MRSFSFALTPVNSAIAVAATILVTSFGLPVLADGCISGKGSSATGNSAGAIAGNPTQVATAGTIVDIAASNESFSTLVQAVQAAGLVETLSGEGPFTVFAPTNEAFAALPEGTLETLLKPENRETLRRVLTYHVVAGAVMSSDIKPGEVATVEGSSVMLQLSDGQVKVNDATVRAADIQASNGVIHVIDRVILPPNL
ncbi:MAG: fasciclin domain-containing protein [Oculatellaceae cyanobacterium Prado106]|nr:fasciclin domain-containing protein [Oculatellaceae cyanobacterium Prado106]